MVSIETINKAMNQDEFWNLIDVTRRETGDVGAQATALIRHLTALPVEDIADYGRHFVGFSDMAYDFRLWAAGYILEGLGDDDFMDFRAWLITRGREAYFKCLNDPEALAEVAFPGERVTAEEINYVAYEAYVAKTGKEDFVERFPFESSQVLKNESLLWQTKEGYADPELLCSLFPRLCERFGKPR